MTGRDHDHDHDHDENEARHLLAPLAADPPGPSAVDVRRAMAAGRRRQRIRRLAGTGAAAAATVLAAAGVPVALDAAGGTDRQPPPAATAPVASPAAASPAAVLTACEAERLVAPDGSYQSLVTAGDPTGRYLAGRSYTLDGPDDDARTRVESVIWDHGVPTRVDIPGYGESFHDINPAGVAVASSYPDRDGQRPMTGWVYRDGKLSALAGVDTVSGRLRIHDHGMIVGARPEPGPDDGAPRLAPVVWQSPEAEPEVLSRPGDSWSVTARDIDADGTVVGSGHNTDEIPHTQVHSFAWSPDGTRQQLPWPEVPDGTVVGFTADLIEDQVVTGVARVELPELPEPPAVPELEDLPDAEPDAEPGAGPDGAGVTGRLLFQYDLRTGEFTQLTAEGFPQAWNHAGWWVGSDIDGLFVASPSGNRLRLPQLPGGAPAESDRYSDALVVSVSEGAEVLGGQALSDRELTGDGGEPRHPFDAVVWRCE